MKLLSVIFLLFSAVINAQVNFQKGYFIDNNNEKIQCFIYNSDWRINPTNITYKLSENSLAKTLSLHELKEFRILETDLFYKKYIFNKDIITKTLGNAQTINRPVLLKVLVEGASLLLEYNIGSEYYFFYEKEGELIYLEHKKTIDANNRVKENNKFKKQLLDNFKCDKLLLADYSKIKYNNTSLSKFFTNYYNCVGADYLNVHEHRTKAKFNFKLKGGLNLITSLVDGNSYRVSYTYLPFSGSPTGETVNKLIGEVDNYNTKTNFSFGVELELRLPFDNNNWSVFLSPNYQNVSEIKGDKIFSDYLVEVNFTSNLSYSFVQIPIGFRRYFDINNEFEIFTQLAYVQNAVTDYSKSKDFTYSSPLGVQVEEEREGNSNSGFYFGVGLSFLSKYAVEINYYSQKINLDSESTTIMKGFAINASYCLF